MRRKRESAPNSFLEFPDKEQLLIIDQTKDEQIKNDSVQELKSERKLDPNRFHKTKNTAEKKQSILPTESQNNIESLIQQSKAIKKQHTHQSSYFMLNNFSNSNAE